VGTGFPSENATTQSLQHFQEKWEPVFRPKMRPRKKDWSAIQFPLKLNARQS